MMMMMRSSKLISLQLVLSLSCLSVVYSDSSYHGFRKVHNDKKTNNLKTIHFVRHAEGHHNVAGKQNPLFGYLREDLEDATLTPHGIEQCHQLHDESKSMIEGAQLLLVSPLNRTLQTATYSFPQLQDKIPWIALESIREQTGLHPCDRRKPVSEHSKTYTHIDFSTMIDNEDKLYSQYSLREPRSDVTTRAREFMSWLEHRPETEIIVVSHCGYLRNLFENVIKSTDSNDRTDFKNAELRTFVIDFSK